MAFAASLAGVDALTGRADHVGGVDDAFDAALAKRAGGLAYFTPYPTVKVREITRGGGQR